MNTKIQPIDFDNRYQVFPAGSYFFGCPSTILNHAEYALLEGAVYEYDEPCLRLGNVASFFNQSIERDLRCVLNEKLTVPNVTDEWWALVPENRAAAMDTIKGTITLEMRDPFIIDFVTNSGAAFYMSNGTPFHFFIDSAKYNLPGARAVSFISADTARKLMADFWSPQTQAIAGSGLTPDQLLEALTSHFSVLADELSDLKIKMLSKDAEIASLRCTNENLTNTDSALRSSNIKLREALTKYATHSNWVKAIREVANGRWEEGQAFYHRDAWIVAEEGLK